MKTQISILLIILFFSSCKNAGNLIISPTQKNGVLAVSEFFGSTVTYRWNFSTSSGEGESTTFKLTIDTLNGFISKFQQRPLMLASNAAVLFYKNLSGEEKSNLTDVEVVLPFKTNGYDMYTFRLGLIDTMASKVPLLDSLTNCLMRQDWASVQSLCPWLEKAGYEMMDTEIKDFKSKLGAFIRPIPMGFDFFVKNDGSEYCRYYAFIEAEKNLIQLSIDFESDLASQNIIGFRFSHKF
ncbi:MAG: hypothetical protein JNJ57_11675 [Saprospiraceae bacterium]|nr:hypothetical protein [Saprospiraceae bacterium]